MRSQAALQRSARRGWGTPAWADTVARIARQVGISIFALDARVASPEAAPDQGAVLELNARPEWLHHTFSEGRQHQVGEALLRACLTGKVRLHPAAGPSAG